jgi:hypothetical protein
MGKALPVYRQALPVAAKEERTSLKTMVYVISAVDFEVGTGCAGCEGSPVESGA